MSTRRHLRVTLQAAVVALVCTPSCIFAESRIAEHSPYPSNWLIYGPKPTYPLQARLHRASGSGVFVLRVNIKSGHVTQVLVGQATGDRELDAAALNTLGYWRFKPGVLPHLPITSFPLNPPLSTGECLLKVPIDFTLKR